MLHRRIDPNDREAKEWVCGNKYALYDFIISI